jgi:hypothetical protein
MTQLHNVRNFFILNFNILPIKQAVKDNSPRGDTEECSATWRTPKAALAAA